MAEAKEGGTGEERSGQERIGCGFNTGTDIRLSSGVGAGRVVRSKDPPRSHLPTQPIVSTHGLG